MGKKIQVHHTLICRQIAKMDMRCYKSEKTLKNTKEQAQRSQELCRKLAYLLFCSDIFVVMDDEKYFIFYGSYMPGNDNFYTVYTL